MRLLTNSLLALLLTTQSVAAAGLEVTLDLLPSTTLPGIPVSLRATFTNRGNAALVLPSYATLLAQRLSGEQSFVLKAKEPFQMRMEEVEGQKLLPGKTATYTFHVDGTLTNAGWFWDDRFSQPGRLGLQLVVADHLHGLSIDDLRRDAVSSNIATLTVLEPTGVDAEVWQAMLEEGNGEWTPHVLHNDFGRALARRIVETKPDSAYTGWLATDGVGGPLGEQAEALRNWMSSHPDDPYSEWRRLRLARMDAILSGQDRMKNPRKPEDYEKRAKTELDKLARQARDEEVRRRAKAELDQLNDSGDDS